ncbi:sialate O-acetylesterase [Salinimicrobium sp. CAU 1759]
MSKHFFSREYSRSWLLILYMMFSLPSLSVHAQQQDLLELGELFQDHMVLQRNKPIWIWGYATIGEQVQVKIGSNSSTTTAGADGKWGVRLPALAGPGPHNILVSTKENQLELTDVLIGDVWIASGQSNMEWPVSGTGFVEKDSLWIKKADIRLLKVHPTMDYQPQTEVTNNGWQTLSPESINNFSAVGYHFAKRVHQETGVPIGVISANLGATSVETWMSNEALAEFPQFPAVPDASFNELQRRFKEGKTVWSESLYYSGIGMENKWYENNQEDPEDWKTLQAAGNTWEALADLKDFDGAVWFRKSFDLPEDFKGDSLDIRLLQIDDHDITWVNGQKIGATFGKHNHRNYKVAATSLKPKDNLLVVRVFDAGGIGGFTTNAFWGNPMTWGDWEYRKGTSVAPEKFVSPVLPNTTPFSSPGALYNGTIAPLTALGITGVIWYQGESNEQRAQEYGTLFPAMIEDWRQQFGQGIFPFLFVQLANYRQEPELPQESLWAELRESQTRALELPKVGMAVAIDLGEAGDIHPKNKEDVGKRLGQLALSMVYGQKKLAHSPFFKSIVIEDDKARLRFDNVGEGLVNTNKYGYIRGFQIAGSDQNFYWAQARLEGNEVVVWSSDVKDPVAVRYGWSDNPGLLDLYNEVGLPLAPFRTDKWRLQTQDSTFNDGPRF